MRIVFFQVLLETSIQEDVKKEPEIRMKSTSIPLNEYDPPIYINIHYNRTSSKTVDSIYTSLNAQSSELNFLFESKRIQYKLTESVKLSSRQFDNSREKLFSIFNSY